MLLKEYIEGLNQFVKNNPESLDMEVVTSSDDEGNSYNAIYYTPTLGVWEEDEFLMPEDSDKQPNVVCVN